MAGAPQTQEEPVVAEVHRLEVPIPFVISGGCQVHMATNNDELRELIRTKSCEVGDGSFICALCGKQIHHANSVRRHFKMMHFRDNTLFRCPACAKDFSNRINLQQHIYTTHPQLKGMDYDTCKIFL